MINKKLFESMKKDLELFDRKREETIDLSRKVISQSKLVIYAVQRGSLDDALKQITKIKELMAKLSVNNYDTNMATVARQEYVEALTFYYYMKENKLVTKDELHVSSYEYLLGLCDLTGELMRKAVNNVINGKISDAENIRNLVDEIYHQFLKLNLRNSELRKKSDQIKWNLEKLENMMYDLKIKRG
jgi:translin